MEFQEGRGLLEVALLLVAALGLDFAELIQGFLELAGEPLAVHTEGGEGAVGVDDVEGDSGLIGGRVGGGWLLRLAIGCWYGTRDCHCWTCHGGPREKF
jgi:hypothetical protein